MAVTPDPDHQRRGPDGATAAGSAAAADVEALHRLPRAYRSWVPGVARVIAALLFTVAGGMLLRSVPEPGAGVAAAAPSRSRPAVAATLPTPAAAVPLTLTAPDLHVLMLSPGGTRTVPPGTPVHLHADVSDGQGGDAVAVDLVWEVRGGGGRVVFTGRGADLLVPAGQLVEGTYAVTVRAFSGPVAAQDRGALRVTAGRA